MLPQIPSQPPESVASQAPATTSQQSINPSSPVQPVGSVSVTSPSQLVQPPTTGVASHATASPVQDGVPAPHSISQQSLGVASASPNIPRSASTARVRLPRKALPKRRATLNLPSLIALDIDEFSKSAAQVPVKTEPMDDSGLLSMRPTSPSNMAAQHTPPGPPAREENPEIEKLPQSIASDFENTLRPSTLTTNVDSMQVDPPIESASRQAGSTSRKVSTPPGPGPQLIPEPMIMDDVNTSENEDPPAQAETAPETISGFDSSTNLATQTADLGNPARIELIPQPNVPDTPLPKQPVSNTSSSNALAQFDTGSRPGIGGNQQEPQLYDGPTFESVSAQSQPKVQTDSWPKSITEPISPGLTEESPNIISTDIIAAPRDPLITPGELGIDYYFQGKN
jgi:hypothetical protein